VTTDIIVKPLFLINNNPLAHQSIATLLSKMSFQNMIDMNVELEQMISYADNSSELSELLISNDNSSGILPGIEEVAAERQMNSIIESEWFDILSQTISSALLFLLIFGMSATVDVKHLREQVHNKFAILTGVATQFLVMPFLGYLSVLLLSGHGLTEPMGISLLIVTASPGGSYSNWWCSMFNADLALSVTMTAISTMVSSVMLPANLLLYVNAAFGASSGSDESIINHLDWPSLFISLAIVILAIALGLFASFKVSSHRFNRFANRMGSMSGILLIVFSGVLSSLSGDKQAQIWAQPWSFYVGVSAPCLVGLFLATCAGVCARLKRPEVISVGVECCYQNVGIATSAAVAMFNTPSERGQALLVPLFYGLMEAVVLGIYCLIGWKLGWTKAPRDINFCTMLVTTFEVDDDDDDSSIQSPTPDPSGGEVDVEMPETRSPGDSVDTWSSTAPVEYDTTWSRWPWKMFIRIEKRKRKFSEDSPPDVNPTTIPPKSVVKRRSILSPISEDAFGTPSSLVSFEDTEKGSYSRCRLGSEEATIASSVLSESPNSSPTRSLFPDECHKSRI
jgi:predicted Na+-dependent transporter